MIGILVLIPLVVLLVVGLVTTFVSVNAYIGVESVHLDKHSLTISLDGEDDPAYDAELGAYRLDGANGLFEVTVLPEMAQDRTYEWTLSNVHSRDANYPDSENGKEDASGNPIYYVELLDSNGRHADSVTAGGYLRVAVHCNFDLTVTASTYKDTCSVVVGGDVTAITLNNELTMRVGEQKMISPRFTPLDGTVTNGEWQVVSGNAVTVDGNGIVTGVVEGSATIRYVADNASGVRLESNLMVVTVSAGASAYGDEISSHLNRFSLSDIGVDVSDVNMQSSRGFTLDGDVFTFEAGATEALISLNGGNDAIVVKKVDADAIEIVESAVIDENDYILEVNGDALYLSARYASVFRRDESVAVTWSVNNDEIASIDADGVVRGLSSGKVIVAAQTAAGEEAKLTLKVQRKVAVLVSAVTNESLQAGLARETIFPSGQYANGDVNNLTNYTFSIGITYPSMFEGEDEASFYEAFEFSVDEEYAALVSFGGENVLGNVMTVNADAVAEHLERGETAEITVTVKAKYPKYPDLPSYTTASFTITLADAIGVRSDPELRDAQEKKNKATVLLNDIHMVNNSNADAEGNFTKTSNIYTYNNVYGNGFTIEAEKDQFIGKTEPFFQVYADDVVISNLTMRPNAFSDEEIEGGDLTINDASTFSAGYCVKYNVTERRKKTGETVTQTKGARIEYCLMENATTLIQLSGAEVEIEGCIMRNTGGVAIHVRNIRSSDDNGTVQHYNNLTMTNCVMSNMVGTAINFDYNNTYYEEGVENRSTFTQKGFFDIYNWQPADSLTLIPSDILDEVGVGEAEDLLFMLIRNAFATEPFIESYRRDYAGQIYMHLGFISIGLSGRTYINDGYLADGTHVLPDGTIEGTGEKADPDEVSWNITIEDSRIKHYTSNDLESIRSIANELGAIKGVAEFAQNLLENPLNIWAYDDDTTDLVPGSVYTVNSRLINRLHGIGV